MITLNFKSFSQSLFFEKAFLALRAGKFSFSLRDIHGIYKDVSKMERLSLNRDILAVLNSWPLVDFVEMATDYECKSENDFLRCWISAALGSIKDGYYDRFYVKMEKVKNG